MKKQEELFDQYEGKHWMFKYEGGQINYWVVWQVEHASENAKLPVRDYEVIHETANLELFRLRSKAITSDLEGEKLEWSLIKPVVA